MYFIKYQQLPQFQNLFRVENRSAINNRLKHPDSKIAGSDYEKKIPLTTLVYALIES